MTIDVFAERWPLVKILNNQKVPAENGWQRDPRRDWRPEELAGFNVGVVCGHGIVVIDIDGKNDGFATYQRIMEPFPDMPRTLTTLTPNNGVHLLFRCPEALPSFSLQGIDFMSAGRQVLLPPSQIETGRYQFEDPSLGIADLPGWFLPFWLGRGGRRESFQARVAASEPPVLREELQAMLGHISPDIGYSDWIRVGMALHHMDPASLPLWDSWSSLGTKYPGEHRLGAHWGSFGKGGGEPATVRTIRYLARQGGYQMPQEVAEAEARAEAPAFQVALPALWRALYDRILASAIVPVPQFAFAASAALVSFAFQRKFRMAHGGGINLYQLICAPSGGGKDAYREAVASSIAHTDAGCAMGGLTTSQGLFSYLWVRSSRIAVLDEFFSFLRSAFSSRDPEAFAPKLASVLLQLTSHHPEWKPDATKENQKLEVEAVKMPKLSIFGCMTTESLDQVMAMPDFIAGGLYSRTEVWVSPEKLPIRTDACTELSLPDLKGALSEMVASTGYRGSDVELVKTVLTAPRVPPKGVLPTFELARLNRQGFRIARWATLHALASGRTHTTEGDHEFGGAVEDLQFGLLKAQDGGPKHDFFYAACVLEAEKLCRDDEVRDLVDLLVKMPKLRQLDRIQQRGILERVGLDRSK